MENITITERTEPKRVTRPCIVCNTDETTPLFTFTRDFLTQVRNQAHEWLDNIGWTEDVSSSIVQCKSCGAKYTRDVVCDYEEDKDELTDPEVESTQQALLSNKQFPQTEKRLWILYNLLCCAHAHFKRDISLLDYGAGSGTWCNTARTLGIQRVFAYEPFNPYPPHLYSKFNFPGIVASRDWHQIETQGPFDTIICNAVFEHLIDPRENVQRMFDHLVPGGFLYLHNPFMDLASELPVLKKATQIKKSMSISHYHPGHVNYLTPKHFRQFVTSFGFEIIEIDSNPFAPTLTKKIKNLARFALTQARLFQGKEFILHKPQS